MTGKYRKLVLILLGLVGINILIMLFIVFPLKAKISSWSEQISKLQAEVQKLIPESRESIHTLGALKEATDMIADFKINTLGKREDFIRSMMEKLDELVYRFRLNRTRTNYKQEKLRGKDIEKIIIQFTVDGEYENIRYFINSLEHSKQFFVLEGVDLKGSEKGNQIQLNLTISTYLVKSS